jgi:hypothetical protein
MQPVFGFRQPKARGLPVASSGSTELTEVSGRGLGLSVRSHALRGEGGG